MNLDEVKIYFPYSEDDELDELYLSRLFEFKQFFIQKPPIDKVFKAKLVKLNKMHSAFELISSETINCQSVLIKGIEFSDRILDAFNYFEEAKGQFKLTAYSALNAIELEVCVLNWLRLTDEYYKKWSEFCDFEVDVDVLSKELDPMDLLAAIREFEQIGGRTFQDISQLKNNQVLMKEMKRVSLLLEKNNQ